MTFADFNISVPFNARGNIKTRCPQCTPHKRKQENRNAKDLSVNIEEGVWHCFNQDCLWKGSLNEAPKKQYVKPPQVDLPLTDKAVQWFKEERGINEVTLRRLKIYSEQRNICFPYYRNGELVNVKYRDAEKKFRLVGGAELILFNYDAVAGQKQIMIVEGEIDALTAVEVGYMTVCSVPNGASTGAVKLDYLDNSYEALEQAEEIIICTDNDTAGVALKNELIRRLGRERCMEITYPDECKDLNEVLKKHGSTGVWEVINSRKFLPVKGILRVTDLDGEIDNAFLYGFEPGVKAGMGDFDNLLNFSGGQLTVISGIPTAGKSTFTDQLAVYLAMRNKWTVALCSPESQPIALHVSNLTRCYLGKPFGQNTMTLDDLTNAKSFLYDHFFWFKLADEDLSVESILEKAAELVKKHGVKLLVIDPWNQLEHKRPHNQSETDYIGDALTKFNGFCKKYMVHVFIVAHPTKIKKKPSGEYETPTLYDISASANWFNKADNGVIIYRDSNNLTTVYVQKVRFEGINGKKGFAQFQFNSYKNRFEPLEQRETVDFTESNYETETPF